MEDKETKDDERWGRGSGALWWKTKRQRTTYTCVDAVVEDRETKDDERWVLVEDKETKDDERVCGRGLEFSVGYKG